MVAAAIDGISELSVLEENKLLKELCVVMDAIGFPFSTGFMIREVGFCSNIAMRNASIEYYLSTGYTWMLDEDRKTVNQYIHNEHYCSLVPSGWGGNHTWDRFTKDVVKIYEANKTRNFYGWSFR